LILGAWVFGYIRLWKTWARALALAFGILFLAWVAFLHARHLYWPLDVLFNMTIGIGSVR
jgi:hypothetical protein